jgi:hypothetical protein
MPASDMIWIVVLVLVVLAWVIARVRRSNRRPIARDPAAFRSVASFSGLRFAQAEALTDKNPQSWGKVLLDELLTHVQPPCSVLNTFSPSYGYAATLLTDRTRLEISVGLVEAGKWYLFVDCDGGERGLPDVDATRTLLRQIDAGLRAMPDVLDRSRHLRWR